MTYPILFGVMAGQGGVPAEPTIGTATATGPNSATVSFTAPENPGGSAITSYTAISTPGNFTGTLSQSGSGTITVTGLSVGTAYTFKVYATNADGNSLQSSSSNQITTPVIAVTSGLLFWLDASDSSSYSGGGSWNDISGNGRNYTKVGSPTHVSSGSASYFTGFAAGDYFSGATNFMPTGSSPRTIISVVRTPSSFSGFQHVFHHGTDSMGQSFGISVQGSGWNTHTWSSAYTPGITATTNTIVMASAGVQNSRTQWWWNNTTAYNGSGTASVNTGNTYNFIGSRVAFGENWDLGGRIYLVAAYNRLLSTGEITSVYNSIKTRFSLP
jgi:hypothetical protein